MVDIYTSSGYNIYDEYSDSQESFLAYDPATQEVLPPTPLSLNNSNIKEYLAKTTNYYKFLFPPTFGPYKLTDAQYNACLPFLIYDQLSTYLLLHGTGVGKTYSSCYIASKWSDGVVILVLNSTVPVWKDMLQKVIPDVKKPYIRVVAYDVSTFEVNFFRALRFKQGAKICFIIDEFAVFISRCISAEGQGERKYHALLRLIMHKVINDGCKILGCTATPFSNTIQEFLLYLEVLRPNALKNISIPDIIKNDRIAYKPDLLHLLYLSASVVNIQSGSAFKNTPATLNYAGKKVIEKYIPMSEQQAELYAAVRKLERGSAARGFRSLTRKVTTFAYGQLAAQLRETMKIEQAEALEAKGYEDFKRLVRSSDTATKHTLLQQASPKLYFIAENCATSKKKAVVYLYFIQHIEMLTLYLEVFGISFVEFSGRNADIREENRRLYNSEENDFGKLYQVMILSDAGSIGVTLRGVMELYIASQLWTDADSVQVMGRAIREKSHSMYTEPVFVDVYICISTLDKVKTADEELYQLNQRKYNLLSQAIDLFKQGSLEQSIGTLIHYDENKSVGDDIILTSSRKVEDAENIMLKYRECINDYFRRQFQRELILTDDIIDAKARVVWYTVNESEPNEGYLHNGNIYSSSGVLIGESYEAEVIIKEGLILYIFS